MKKKDVKILLVDDEPDILEILSYNLSAVGYTVYTAKNGLEGVEKAKKKLPHLIILDVMMPEMDGIELARKASELDPTLKIMFITGFAAVTLNTDAAPNDARVLSKPFHLKELVGEIDGLLADK